MSGSGGLVPARQPLSGDLIGDSDADPARNRLLSVSSITISANTATTGTITARCVPDEDRQASETLTVFPQYTARGNRPHTAPYHSGRNRRTTLSWHRSGGSPRHDGAARHSHDGH